MSFFDKFKNGLKKTSSSISEKFSKIFSSGKLDQNTLDSLEEVLISADVGHKIASELVSILSAQKFGQDVQEYEIRSFLADKISSMIKPFEKRIEFKRPAQLPQVILFCGVNGNGKTTTISKLANKFQKESCNVLIVAADTFRAAAVDQLADWALKLNCEIYKGRENQDPSSVIYESLQHAIDARFDVILIDTAGRLHNKKDLMEQLSKFKRVIHKVNTDLDVEVLLVVDSTTGQNVLTQIELFKDAIDLNGMIVTKIDSSAKAGFIIQACTKYQIHICALTMGEGLNDITDFSADFFAKNLMGIHYITNPL